MPSNNLTIRYSQMSAVQGTVTGEDLILVGQPDPTNLKTGWNVFKTKVSKLSDYFKDIVKNEGFGDRINVGPGIIKTPPKNALALDEEFFDNLAIRHDKLNLSYVGDRAFPVLPLSGSYFAINYPYDVNEQCAVAYLESSGDAMVIAPVTNGFQRRYTYTTLKGWSTGTWSAETSDTVYQPPGLLAGEYVSAAFPPSETAMVIEITNANTNVIEYAVVLLNGTFSYQHHTLIRCGKNIPQWLNGDANTNPRILQDRPPAVYVRNGKIIIVGAIPRATAQGVSLRWGEVDRNNGSIRAINSVRITGRSNTELRSDGIMDVTRGFYTTDPDAPGMELLGDKTLASTSSTAGAGGGAFKSVGVSIAQSKHGVRVALRRADSMSYAEGSATAPYFYTFTTIYDVYEDPALHSAEIHMREADNSVMMRHSCNITITAITFSDDYKVDRNGTFSAAQSPYVMFLTDGSMYLSSAATSAATNARNYIYRGKKGMDAWSAAYNIRAVSTAPEGISYTGNIIPFILPALTPIVARAACNYLATNMTEQNNGNAGSIFTTNTNYAAESKPSAYAMVKGFAKDNTFELIDYGSVKGYTLNNDRARLMDAPNLQITSFQDRNRVIRHTHTFFSSLDNAALDRVQNHEITPPYNVISTMKLPASVRAQFINDIMSKFSVGDRALTWRFTCLPGDTGNRALYVVNVADKDNPDTFQAYGVMSMSVSVSGSERTITGIDILSTTPYILRLPSVYYLYFSYPYNSGWAACENADGTLDMLVKEGMSTGAKNGAGGVARPLYHMRRELDGTITYFGGIPSRDGTYSVVYPTVGPRDMGLATIDATAGFGTNYVLRPVVPTTDPEIDKGILIGSPTPSQRFTVNIGGDIPVQLNGAVGVIPAQSIDLTRYVGNGVSPANTTFYFYAVEINKQVQFEILTTPMNETLARTLFAVVKTNDEVVTSVKATPFSRLGLYRLSYAPQGSSVPYTQGSYADYVDRFWLTRWYGGDINWDDYYIPETITEGPFQQILTLAPGATLEMVVHGAGGGGGGSRFTGGEWVPEMSGGNAEHSVVLLNDQTIASIGGGLGGQEGWWGNGSHYSNGTGGPGADAGRPDNGPPGAVLDILQYTAGGKGEGDWDRSNNGGVRGTFPNPGIIPSYVPALPGLGHGGAGALGLGDEGWGYGGGGGAGGSFFMRVKNIGTGPLNITVIVGQEGQPGVSARNGYPGRKGVAWWKQMPKT